MACAASLTSLQAIQARATYVSLTTILFVNSGRYFSLCVCHRKAAHVIGTPATQATNALDGGDCAGTPAAAHGAWAALDDSSPDVGQQQARCAYWEGADLLGLIYIFPAACFTAEARLLRCPLARSGAAAAGCGAHCSCAPGAQGSLQRGPPTTASLLERLDFLTQQVTDVDGGAEGGSDQAGACSYMPAACGNCSAGCTLVFSRALRYANLCKVCA